jgi:hypothetical protein
MYTRRSTGHVLNAFTLPINTHSYKQLTNVNSDSTKSYFWVNFIVKSTVTGGRDSLFCFKSTDTTNIILIATESPNVAGSSYELTFPRWLKNSELLAYPYKQVPSVPVFDMKYFDAASSISHPITNDYPAHHVDDLTFTIDYLPADTFLATMKNSKQLNISKKNSSSGYFQYQDQYSTPTSLDTSTGYVLSSFEPFTVNGNNTYGAYEIYEGTGIPGNTKGEIWLQGILGDTLRTKISTFNGVTVDPEYYIGNTDVYVFYYGKAIGAPYYDLHRCATPLKINPVSINNIESGHAVNVAIFPNPAVNALHLSAPSLIEDVRIYNLAGIEQISTRPFRKDATIDISELINGMYIVRAVGEQWAISRIILKK